MSRCIFIFRLSVNLYHIPRKIFRIWTTIEKLTFLNINTSAKRDKNDFWDTFVDREITKRNNTFLKGKFLIFRIPEKIRTERDSKYNVFLYTLPLHSSRGYSYIKDFRKEHDKFSSQSRGNIFQSMLTRKKFSQEVFSGISCLCTRDIYIYIFQRDLFYHCWRERARVYRSILRIIYLKILNNFK